MFREIMKDDSKGVPSRKGRKEGIGRLVLMECSPI